MGFDKDGYWSPREILGYNCTYNWVLSDRGRGKTVSLKGLMVGGSPEEAMRQRHQDFMCLYRDSSDMAHAISTWTEDLVRHKGWSHSDFRFEGSAKEGFLLHVDDVPSGYFRYLSAVNHIKQESYPDTLNYVWLDECLPLAWKKLQGVKSEGDALRTIMKTIDHDSVHPRVSRGFKKLRCFLVGNPHNADNPLLSYFHIDPSTGYGIHRIGPEIVLENILPIEDERKGPLTVDDFLGAEVHKATGWNLQTGFIRDVPSGSRPTYSVRVGHRFYALLYGPDSEYYVVERNVSEIVSRNHRYGTLEGMKEGEMGLGEFSKILKKRIENGRFYYPDLNTKFNFQNDINEL